MLCLHPFCEHDSEENECQKCGPVNITLATQYCLNAEIVVIKTIRLCSLKSLKNILEDTTLDVKVSYYQGCSRDPLVRQQTRFSFETKTGKVRDQDQDQHRKNDVIIAFFSLKKMGQSNLLKTGLVKMLTSSKHLGDVF